MILDAQQQLPQGELEFDVCIVGAGAAGISLALALEESGLSVGVMEGGGYEPPTPQELDPYGGEVGFRPYALEGSRLRYLGGTTNHWGGWCRPLDPVDFEARSDCRWSGWPFGLDVLSEYYPRAHELCQVGGRGYDAASVLSQRPRSILSFPESSGFVSKLFRFSPPTRFGEAYREELLNSEIVRVFLNANLMGFKKQGDRIAGLNFVTHEGDSFSARAENYVLAMGGIENARILLASGVDGSGAIGNHSDWVGRCFMDHFGYAAGFMTSRADLQYFRFQLGEEAVMPVISMSDEALRKHRLRNFCATLDPSAPDETFPPGLLLNPIFGAGRDDAGYCNYRIQFICEPRPDPMSRVKLIAARDRLGMPRVRLDWHIAREDFSDLERAAELLGAALGEAGLGRFQHLKRDSPRERFQISGGLHHMGTTRMADDPSRGVVDADCRVHHLENLFLAGSSVFPTVGFSNPTLTIVALVLRLSDRLRSGS